MKSKIKITALRDRVALYSLTGYNDSTTGLPGKTYSTTAIGAFAMVRRSLGSKMDTKDDKTTMESNFEITVRIDSIVYKPEDKLVWDGHTMYIRDIQQIDLWYQKLICFREY